MRGEQSNGLYVPTPDTGITPACAGNSKALALCARIAGDHPRLRGEQGADLQIISENVGSPPLARGTGNISRVIGLFTRITPACAGNRRLFAKMPKYLWDHPRLRGEQFLVVIAFGPSYRSPPLARGTVTSSPNHGVSLRITPACAGNSGGQATRRKRPWDHPRLRGEQKVYCRRPMAN